MKPIVSKIKVGNDLKSAVKKAAGNLSQFKGEEVLIKPNYNTNDPFPASTDPEFLKVIIELLYSVGAKKVIVAESCRFFSDSRKQMEHVIPIAEKAGVEFVLLTEKNDWKKVKVNGKYLKSISMSETFLKAKKQVWLPCLKTHFLGKFTMSLKLPIGMLNPKTKLKLHNGNLERRIADLHLVLKAPDLIIMDARKCFITGGPTSGIVREPNLILSSTDRIAIDVEGIKVIQSFEGNSLVGKDPWELLQIKTAVENNIGSVKSEKDYKLIS